MAPKTLGVYDFAAVSVSLKTREQIPRYLPLILTTQAQYIPSQLGTPSIFTATECIQKIYSHNQSSIADGTFDVDRALETGWKNLGVNQREDHESRFKNLIGQIEAEKEIDGCRHIANGPVG